MLIHLSPLINYIYIYIKRTHLRWVGVQLQLMQLLAVNAKEPFGTIRLSLCHFRFADEHAAQI